MSILILLWVSLTTSGQAVTPKAGLIQWKNIAQVYKDFKEIKPALINQEDRSLFLSRIWPHGSAQLKRYNESRRKWELGSWGIGCGTVAYATVPIEIKPKSEHEIHVYWQLSTDDWDNPKHFVVNETLEKRPLRGKYRFILRYALTPWTVAHHPDRIYVVESPEFIVRQ